MEEEKLIENAEKIGNYLMEKLNELKEEPNSHITDVRGRGLIIGIDLDIPQKDVRQQLIYNEHCFTGCTGTNTLRLLPPLCINQQEADSFIEKFKRTLKL
jgi:acetylornithine aminotransferase